VIVLHPTFHPKFVQFLKEFNDINDYFECHEVLEDYWKEIAPRQKNHPLTAFILMSTSMYHWRRGNIPGAIKTMNKSIKRFIETYDSSFFTTLDFKDIMQSTTNSLLLMQKISEFQPFSIQIIDSELLSLVNKLKIKNSDELHFLIHKHMLRDRSEILEVREKSKKRRDDKW
jgi:predicted metal-dependent hydrolase